jgi:hypothetical protein
MSADAQPGSAPSYRDSVREMMRELKSKGTKGSNAAKVVAQINEDKPEQIILVKHILFITVETRSINRFENIISH